MQIQFRSGEGPEMLFQKAPGSINTVGPQTAKDEKTK